MYFCMQNYEYKQGTHKDLWSGISFSSPSRFPLSLLRKSQELPPFTGFLPFFTSTSHPLFICPSNFRFPSFSFPSRLFQENIWPCCVALVRVTCLNSEASSSQKWVPLLCFFIQLPLPFSFGLQNSYHFLPLFLQSSASLIVRHSNLIPFFLFSCLGGLWDASLLWTCCWRAGMRKV